MGGSTYIKLPFLLAIYILMAMTPNLSLEQFNINLHSESKNELDYHHCHQFEMNAGNQSYLELKQPMLKMNNCDLINKLYVFLTSKVFRFNLTGKILNLTLYLNILDINREKLTPFRPKCLVPDLNKCYHNHFNTYFILLHCACFLFLLLHKQLKSEDNILFERNNFVINTSDIVTFLSSMFNIKGGEKKRNIFTSDHMKDKYGWLFKHFHKIAPTNIFVYPAINLEHKRIASFSPLIDHKDSNISILKLANAGFFYTKNDLLVECEKCGNQEEIYNITSSPFEGKYHKPGCIFVQTENYNEKQGNFDSVYSTQSQDSLSDATEPNMSSGKTPDDSLSSNHDSIQGATANMPLQGQNAGFISKNTSQNTDNIEYDPVIHIESQDTHFGKNLYHNFEIMTQQNYSKNDTLLSSFLSSNTNANFDHADLSKSQIVANNYSQELPKILPAGGVEPILVQHVNSFHTEIKDGVGRKERINYDSDRSSGYFSNEDVEFDDSDNVQPEYDNCSQDGQTSRETCKKNHGHFGYFPMWNFKLDYIPSNVRHPDVFTFLELVSKLTVRVIVGKTSKDRPKSHFVENGQRYRFGTGYAVSEIGSNYHISTPEQNSHDGKLNMLKKCFHKHKDYIYVETNQHLVYDDVEAKHTTIEFFYDNPNRKGIVIAKGVSICHSLILGDMKSILICTTSDSTLVNMVNESSNAVTELIRNFSLSIKEEMMLRVFLIGHPHGGEKMFCYGEHVMVKYELVQENVNDRIKTKIVKINNSTQISQNADKIRKVMLYTADTCNGCIGSPVIYFKKTGSGETERIVLDMWMHNGLDRKNGLNASILKALTPEDIANHGQPVVIRTSIQRMSEEADRAANQVVFCPVFTVYKSPSHPAYAANNKRLLSYPTPFKHVHTAKDLADAGFFYSGYEDCVRCFQCGLGLKSWKQGDNIYEEHGKNRPDCQFLQLRLREAGLTNLRSQSNSEQTTDSSRNITSIFDVLKREQWHLKQILICKVCSKRPVRDLFLPCGELVACIECSKLLTHCPVCNKKILATVTTYFS